jgi:hypothetical protein
MSNHSEKRPKAAPAFLPSLKDGVSREVYDDLGDIAAYSDGYLDYMAFAKSQAPGAICHVDYAKLTRTPEPVIRRVLDFCGLPFDPACLAPEKNDRQIQTASYKQARVGIYQGSTSKWRGFEPHLKPLMDHFGAG